MGCLKGFGEDSWGGEMQMQDAKFSGTSDVQLQKSARARVVITGQGTGEEKCQSQNSASLERVQLLFSHSTV